MMVGLVVCIIWLSVSACATTSTSGSTAKGSQPATATAGITPSATSTPKPTSTPIPTPTPHGITQDGLQALHTFQQWITRLQNVQSDVSVYQQQYTADHDALQNARGESAYQRALQTLNGHIEAIRLPTLKGEALSMRSQLEKKVATFQQQHPYYNAYDKTTYQLGYEYGENGVAWLMDMDFASAQTADDYQHVINDLTTYVTNFDAMVRNKADKTPYDQPHATDTQLINTYGLSGKVVVVSLQEEAARMYQDGKLVNAFYVTTGKPHHPSLPGWWRIEWKVSPTVFKSGAQPGSEAYYKDTPINYAMQYHSDGYFLHDSWWRADYGPGTQFPHYDSGGDYTANMGSHGCVNVSKANAKWLYGFVDYNTTVLIY